MKTMRVGAALLLANAWAMAGDFSGTSPDGKLSFASKDEKDFFVWKTDKPSEKAKIYHEEAVFIQAAAISPDNVWIALEHGGSSLGHTLAFFRRDKGLDYFIVGGPNDKRDPMDLVGEFALKSVGIKENILDHSYLHPVKWGAKSQFVIVSLDGKGVANGKQVKVTNWQCAYNPVTQQVLKIKDNPGKVETTAAN